MKKQKLQVRAFSADGSEQQKDGEIKGQESETHPIFLKTVLKTAAFGSVPRSGV